MPPSLFTIAFVVALIASLGIRFWLAARQIAHVRAHRDAMPPAFADRVDANSHRKAADYTIAKQRQGMLEMGVDAIVLVAITLGGGLGALFAATTGANVNTSSRIAATALSFMATSVERPLRRSNPA